MNSSLWYYSDTLQTYGPVAVHQLTAMIQGGQLTAGHFIMPEGGQEWQVVGSSPFAAYLPMASPPPTSAGAAAPQQAPAAATVTKKPAAPPVRTAGKPQPTPSMASRPTAQKNGLPVGLISAAAAIVLAGGGWWFTRPAPILERKNTTRIEGEAMEILKVTGGEVEPQSMSRFPTGRWSGNSQLFWQNGAMKYVLNLGFKVDATEAGKQRLRAVLTGARDYAVVKVSLDGKTVPGAPIDMRRQDIMTSDLLDWGIHQLAAGAHELQFEIIDSNAATPEDRAKFCVGLDYIQLEPPTPLPPVSAQPSPAPVLAAKSPSTAIPLPASPIEIRPTQRNGKSSAIKFVNQLSADVEIQFVNWNGKLSNYGRVKTGTTRNQHTFGGHVWVIATLDGHKLGLVEAEDTESTVTLDSKGVHQIRSPQANIAAVTQPPAGSNDLRPSREDGDPARLRFTNKLGEEVKIQFVNSQGKITKSWNLKDGRTTSPRSNIGYVWLVTAKNGNRLGAVECTTDRSTVIIDTQGVKVQTDAVPTHESLQLLPLVQFAGTNIGDAVAVLRQRATEAGLKVEIELDPRVDPKSGSINFDARVAPISEILGLCAYHAGARMEHRDSSFRIVPR